MNKIVRENYPVSKLPDDLREGIDPRARVRVVVEADEGTKAPLPLNNLIGAGRGLYQSPEEALQAIRRLRDEWN